MADLASLLRSRRVQVWGGLLVALGVAVLLLVLAQRSRSGSEKAAQRASKKDRGPIKIRVVDPANEPVSDARAFVTALEGAAGPDDAGTWSPDDAILALPRTGEPRSIVVQARGYRIQRIDDVRGDRLMVLQPGLVARFAVTGEPALPAEPVGLYFKVDPLRPDDGPLEPAERDTILDLMEARAEPPAGLPPFPRQGFGFLISRLQGDAGIVLPRAGRYRVTWGLLNEKRGTWYALPEGSDVVIDVADEPPEQTFEIEVTTAAVDRAKADLDEIMRRQAGG